MHATLQVNVPVCSVRARVGAGETTLAWPAKARRQATQWSRSALSARNRLALHGTLQSEANCGSPAWAPIVVVPRYSTDLLTTLYSLS